MIVRIGARSLARLVAIAGAVVAAEGCDATPPANTESVTGQLGHGTFYYDCVDSSDPYCPATSSISSFPPAIAVGGRFVIAYAANGVDYSAGSLVAVNGDFVLDEGAASGSSYPGLVTSSGQAVSAIARTFGAARAGTGTILVQQSDGTVIDTTPVTITAPSAAVIAGSDGGVDPPNPSVGQSVFLTAHAQGPASQPLAGSLPWTWTSSNPGVAALLASQGSGPASGPVTVLFEDAGTASVTAASGTLHSPPVTFTVVP